MRSKFLQSGYERTKFDDACAEREGQIVTTVVLSDSDSHI